MSPDKLSATPAALAQGDVEFTLLAALLPAFLLAIKEAPTKNFAVGHVLGECLQLDLAHAARHCICHIKGSAHRLFLLRLEARA